MSKAKSPKGPADESVEVLERFAPSEDAVTDGDPAFEYMLDDETLPADRHFVWVHKNENAQHDMTRMYRGKRYVEVRGGEGINMLSGLSYEDGEPMYQADHVLMSCDKELHDARTKRERAQNNETRKKMLSKDKTTGTVYVNTPGGPGAMNTRG